MTTKIVCAVLTKLNSFPTLYDIEIISLKKGTLTMNWYICACSHMTKTDPRWMHPWSSREKDGVKTIKVNIKGV